MGTKKERRGQERREGSGGGKMRGLHDRNTWVNGKAKLNKKHKQKLYCSNNVILTCFMMAKMKSGSNLRE